MPKFILSFSKVVFGYMNAIVGNALSFCYIFCSVVLFLSDSLIHLLVLISLPHCVRKIICLIDIVVLF